MLRDVWLARADLARDPTHPHRSTGEGMEDLEAWHRAGMLGNKQNVFDDFHAAASTLLERGWTTAEQLAISGGSTGCGSGLGCATGTGFAFGGWI